MRQIKRFKGSKKKKKHVKRSVFRKLTIISEPILNLRLTIIKARMDKLFKKAKDILGFKKK